MGSVSDQAREVYSCVCPGVPLEWGRMSDFRSVESGDPTVRRCAEIEEALAQEGLFDPYLNAVYIHLFGSVINEAEGNDAPGEEGSGENGRNEDSFDSRYPGVDTKEVLKKSYVQWLSSMTNKPFFKTIAMLYDMAKMNQLNFVDRAFLWKFLKAVSSCITHLLIEGEQREESVCLVDMYFDSLNDCLLSTIHAKDKEDVIQAFIYMVSFLGLNRDPVDGSSEDLGASVKDGSEGSVGEF